MTRQIYEHMRAHIARCEAAENDGMLLHHKGRRFLVGLHRFQCFQRFVPLRAYRFAVLLEFLVRRF